MVHMVLGNFVNHRALGGGCELCHEGRQVGGLQGMVLDSPENKKVNWKQDTGSLQVELPKLYQPAVDFAAVLKVTLA